MDSLTLSPQDIYYLARILSYPPRSVEALPASPGIKLLTANLDPQKAEDWQLLRRIIGQSEILKQILAVDPDAPPPTPPKRASEGDMVYVPELPKAVQLSSEQITACQQVGRWQNAFMAWATQRAIMTPQAFLEFGGLFIVGLAIARRAALRLDFETVFPNLYGIVVATTGYFKKTTGLRAVEDTVMAAMPHMLLSAQTTPEMLLFKASGRRTPNYDNLSAYDRRIEDQGARFAGQRGIIADEVTKLFVSKKYLEGMPELYMEFFNAPPVLEREIRSEGKLIVRDPAMSLYGATTPARLSRTFGETEWEDGLAGRIAFLTPTEKVIKRVPSKLAGTDYLPPRSLVGELVRLHTALPEPPVQALFDSSEERPSLEVVSLSIEPAAMDAFNAYTDALHEMMAPGAGLDERLKGNYTRLHILAVKVALILTLQDWSMEGDKRTPRITLLHWQRSQHIVEGWRASVHRLLSELTKSEDVKCEERILDFLSRGHDKPPTRREIHKATGIPSRKDSNAAIDALLASGVLQAVPRHGERGPVTEAFVLVE